MNYILWSILLFLGCSPKGGFQIQCYSVSHDASYIVDIAIAGKNELSDISVVKLSAIEGVLFRGITSNNCVAQPPLLKYALSEVRNNNFFRAFYGKEKSYNKYITDVTFIGVTNLSQANKYSSHVNYRITINKSLLKQDLISSGLIQQLNERF